MTWWLLPVLLLSLGQVEADPERANRLFMAALDQRAELNLDSALVLLRAARDADLSNLAIHLEYLAHNMRWTPAGHMGMRREYAQLPDAPVVRCLRAYLRAPPDYVAGAGPALLEMEERGEGEGCPTVLLPGILREMRPFEVWDPRRLEYYRRALALAPEVGSLWTEYAQTLASQGRPQEGERVLGEAILALSNPIQRVSLNMRRAEMAFVRGDTALALALRRAVAAAVDRDGRPGLRLEYFSEQDGLLGRWEEGEEDAWARPLRRLASFSQEHGAWNREWQARYGLGMRSTDRGYPLLAVQELDRAVAIADSVGIPSLQAQSYYKRGRALGRQGRWEEAEEDLLRAVDFARASESPYFIAEAWHNLYQMYTDAGRLEEAVRAGDRFLEAAEPLRHSPLRWAAHLEAGEVRWKLGWHAAANEAFARAVSVIDDHREYHNYAGEFFERMGDLAQAKEYYARGTAAYGGGAESVRALSWAGLARVYLELGQTDSARVAAIAHDASLANERSVPLLPSILAEEGEIEQAMEIASEWARRRLEARNLAGAAVAHLQWAELSLAAGDPEAAVMAALRADSLATLVDLVDEPIQAARFEGLAQAALGDTASALATLRRASTRAAGLSSSGTLESTRLALGDLLAALGRIGEALAAYEEAAELVLETTAGLETDLDRVRFMDRHIRPYDGAVGVLLRAFPEEMWIPELARWSQRRKATALRLALAGVPGLERPTGVLSIREIQSRLANSEALVDFQIVGGSAWALVIRNDLATLRHLPVAVERLAASIQTLITPFSQVYGGRLDLARAIFDEARARDLYDLVWRPFSDLLTGITRVYLVPDGALHRLPFSALVLPEMHRAEEGAPAGPEAPAYLMEEYELLYLPSIGFLPDSKGRPWSGHTSSSVLVVAGTAPGADDEIQKISRVWTGAEVRVLSGEDASESNALAVSRDFDVLHFATHGVADDRDPLASHLKLTSDSESDGLLHPVEIARMASGQRLVVLSACETHSGRGFRGEGLMGLTRAFLSTGAEAVVGTQWLLGSQASLFMESFYGHLSNGSSPPAALRAAQMDLRSRPETSHPFFWAAFLLFAGGA